MIEKKNMWKTGDDDGDDNDEEEENIYSNSQTINGAFGAAILCVAMAFAVLLLLLRNDLKTL